MVHSAAKPQLNLRFTISDLRFKAEPQRIIFKQLKSIHLGNLLTDFTSALERRIYNVIL